MKILRILIIVLLMVFIHYEGMSQKCQPHEKGYYMYYVNLNLDVVSNDFSKADFLNLLKDSEHISDTDFDFIDSIVLNVKKSFPTAVSDFLQHSISVNAYFDELDSMLQNKSDFIGLIEKKCAYKSLLESNDYHTVSAWIGGDTYHDLIKTNKAWDLSTGDERILIGCTDTYLNENHEDLSNQVDTIIDNAYFNQGESAFHGTSVASCLVAETNNNLGVASVGNKSKLVFSDNWGDDSEVLLIAQIPRVRVINLSWGGLSYSYTDDVLYDEIRNIHNVVVVAGAGNGLCWENKFCLPNNGCEPCSIPMPCDGGYVGSGTCQIYPSSYDNVISVTSVGHSFDLGTTYTAPDGKYWGEFLWKDCHQSKIGNDTTHSHNGKVNISAPGYAVYASSWGFILDSLGNVVSVDNTRYLNAWGTSFASPIVASACALVAATNPCLTASEIQDIVLSTADPNIYFIPENQAYINQLGTGRLDVFRAIEKTLKLETIYIQNKAYSGSTVTESSKTMIKAGYNVQPTLPYGLVRILPSSNVTFEAPHSIELSDGFEVKNNAFFEAKIIDYPCY